METTVSELDTICYDKNYLKEVLVRVDFSGPIEGIEKKLSPSFEKQALQRFQIAEPQAFVVSGLQVSGGETKSLEMRAVGAQGTDWYFHDKNHEKTLSVQQTCFWIRYTKYGKFETLKGDFEYILSHFCENYKGVLLTRTGIRYINFISIPGKGPFDWKDLVNPKMLHIFDVAPGTELISRALHILELNYGDQNLRFQYGMNNPDFPAPIRQNHFILDLDAYVQGPQEPGEALSNIAKGHGRIQCIFEDSITSKLREQMYVAK
ncbi:TIGR04255 family protein [bacterium]|nr:TIGR04255 family protein [bacterium]MBU1983461.1 TIGR04255 family protein [bacterium]